ncbi:MAG: hypothetical protein AB8G86_05595, partial [Saprospiraceae bacterium]
VERKNSCSTLSELRDLMEFIIIPPHFIRGYSRLIPFGIRYLPNWELLKVPQTESLFLGAIHLSLQDYFLDAVSSFFNLKNLETGDFIACFQFCYACLFVL